MSRDLTSALATAIASGTVHPVFFYEGEFSTGTLRLWSGVGDYSWNGYTWTGAGNVIGIEPITERSDISAPGFAISLTGEASAIISLNLSAARQGLGGTVWLGAFNSSGALIADPYVAFSGRLDVPRIGDDGETCRISVSYESRLVDLDRSRERRYTTEDQQLDYSNDTGFRFVTALQNAQITWGRAGNAIPAVPGSVPASSSGGSGGADSAGGAGSMGAGGGGAASGGSSASGALFDLAPSAWDTQAGAPVTDLTQAPADVLDLTGINSPSGTQTGAPVESRDAGSGVAGTGDVGSGAFGSAEGAGLEGGGDAGGGGGGGGAGKIICTELYLQGLMPREIYEADQRFGRRLAAEDPVLMQGYHALATPIVHAMQRSALAARLVSCFALPWAREMAYREGAAQRGSALGAAIMTAGRPLCRVVGLLLRGDQRCA